MTVVSFVSVYWVSHICIKVLDSTYHLVDAKHENMANYEITVSPMPHRMNILVQANLIKIDNNVHIKIHSMELYQISGNLT